MDQHLAYARLESIDLKSAQNTKTLPLFWACIEKPDLVCSGLESNVRSRAKDQALDRMTGEGLFVHEKELPGPV